MKPIIKGLSMSVLAMSLLLPSSVSFADENIDSSQAKKTVVTSKPPSLDPEDGYHGSDRTMQIVNPNHKLDRDGEALRGEYEEKVDEDGKGVGKAVLNATGGNPTLVY
ncbi:TPA: hypothetical protein ACTZ5V_004777 [Bacillus cereus]